MHPKLFPAGDLTIYTYGFMVMLGAISGFFYLSYAAGKELGIERHKIQNLCVLMIISAIVGGKFFFYLENPSYYFSSFKNLGENLRNGFVFYGSLFFAVPVIIWYFRKNKWPVWPMLDQIAIFACIVHGTGRLGCFFAGCCYGVETDVPWAITFTHADSEAPLNTPLHPTQLYSAAFIYGILATLLMLKRHKRFKGRLFFIYILLYATGRAVIELFRGDEARGYIIEDTLSYSQFISILVIISAAWFYFRLKQNHSGTDP